jgi:hypothetical protein
MSSGKNIFPDSKGTSMLRVLIPATIMLVVAGGALAKDGKDDKNDDSKDLRARLTGLKLTPPVVSTGSGTLQMDIQGQAIAYQLGYRNLQGGAPVATLYVGDPGQSGGAVATLCGPPDAATPPEVDAPAPPPPRAEGAGLCPTTNPLVVSGKIVRVAPLPDQGILGVADLIAAVEGGAAFVRIVTANHPAGEIGGRVEGISDDD